MIVRTDLAISQALQEKRIWLVVCSGNLFPDAQRAVSGCLTRPEWMELTDREFPKADNVIFENTHGANPLARYEKILEERLARSRGTFSSVGYYPGEIPESLETHVSTIKLFVDYGRLLRFCRDKFKSDFETDPGTFTTSVEQLFPLSYDLPPDVWGDLVEKSANLRDLEERLRKFPISRRLPPVAFGLHQVWIPGLMARVSNLDRKREAVEGLLIASVGRALIKRKPGETVFLPAESHPAADRDTAELAAIYVNGYYDGQLIEVDLARISPADLDFSAGSILQKLLNGAMRGSSLNDPVAVWITGARKREEVEQVVKQLSVAFNVAAVFYNPLHVEKINERRESMGLLNIKKGDVLAELGEQMMRAEEGNALLTLWVGRMLKVANYLANVVGFMAIFLRPDPIVQFRRLVSSGDFSDKLVLMVGFFVALGISYGIYHFEISGLAHFRTSAWARLKLLVGYPSGSLLNLVSFLIIAPLPDGLMEATVTLLILSVAAFLLDFLGDIMTADAGAALERKRSGGSALSERVENDHSQEAAQVAPVQNHQQGSGNGTVKVVKLTEFAELQTCSAPNCQNRTNNAVVAKIYGKTLNFAACSRGHKTAVERDPKVLEDWTPR